MPRTPSEQAGTCPECRAAAQEPGRSRCRRCLDRARDWCRARAAAGACRCGAAVQVGRRKCGPCLDVQRRAKRAKYHARKAAGACGTAGCGARPDPPHAYCPRCRAAITAAATRSRRRRAGSEEPAGLTGE